MEQRHPALPCPALPCRCGFHLLKLGRGLRTEYEVLRSMCVYVRVCMCVYCMCVCVCMCACMCAFQGCHNPQPRLFLTAAALLRLSLSPSPSPPTPASKVLACPTGSPHLTNPCYHRTLQRPRLCEYFVHARKSTPFVHTPLPGQLEVPGIGPSSSLIPGPFQGCSWARLVVPLWRGGRGERGERDLA